jgi:Protein of unknown function (DUF2800)
MSDQFLHRSRKLTEDEKLAERQKLSRIEPAHSPFGGSVATRVLRCPASVGLVEKVPAHLRRVSAYAERGTALHAAMALLIERERSLEDFIGETIEGYRITADDVENALRPALAHVETLLDAPDAEYYLEQRVVFPTILGAFGTVDLIIRVDATIYVVDLKFGVRCARARALSRWRRGRHQRTALVLCRGCAEFVS